MNLTILPYQNSQCSFKSKVKMIKHDFIRQKSSQNNVSDITLLALKANLKALKAEIGHEVVSSFTNTLHGKSNLSELANSKLANVNGAVEDCINKIVSKNELQNNPELHTNVLKMKADALQEITDMLKIIIK